MDPYVLGAAGLPSWRDLSRPGPRQPFPELLHNALGDTTIRAARFALRAKVLEAFQAAEAFGTSTDNFAVIPPEAEGGQSWLTIESTWEAVIVRASLLGEDGAQLPRERLNVLLDLEFELKEYAVAECMIALDRRDPKLGWRLGSDVAVVATWFAYYPWWGGWSSIDAEGWSLSALGYR